ncbi:hypothetical protein SprV_1002849100 [Sparganum proliferum]
MPPTLLSSPLTRTAPWRTAGTQSSRMRWPSSFAHPATYNLLSEKDCLQKAYIDHPFDDDNKAAFYHCRRLVQQRLRKMQNAQAACKAKEIQGFADHNEWKNSFSAIYCPPPNVLHLSSAPTEIPRSPRRHKFCSDWPNN